MLASAGENLKLWDTTTSSLLHQVQLLLLPPHDPLLQHSVPHAIHVSSCSWSPDTSCVASVLKVGTWFLGGYFFVQGKEQLLLTYFKKGTTTFTSHELPLQVLLLLLLTL